MTDRCGTEAGYQTHRRDRTTPCLPCIRANSAAGQARDQAARNAMRTLKVMTLAIDDNATTAVYGDRIVLPTHLFAELYLSASIPMQEHVEALIPQRILDAARELHDHHQEAS